MILRILRWLGLGLAALILLAALVTAERYYSLRKSLPQVEGTVAVDGLSAPVEILRDRHAIAHIYAADLPQALYGLGFAHAQDRLWQMMFFRRIAHGRLAELFGPLAVDVDLNMRALGLKRYAQASFSALPADAQAALIAYADGVNAALDAHEGPWPPEFTMTASRPERWEPTDSLALMNVLGLSLAMNAATELTRLDLGRLLGAERLGELMAPLPGLPEGYQLPNVPDGNDALRSPEDAIVQSPLGASNNWVVDGTWTVSGKPLLANDPHLGLTVPGIWYLAHLSYGDEIAVGASVPGIPTILLGHNGYVAWGFTNTGADVQDLVLERINADDESLYDTPNGPIAFETREEDIKVRFGGTRTETLRFSRHGPLLPVLQERAPPGHAYAFSWVGLTPENTSYASAVKVLSARTVEDAREALRDYVIPMQNVVIADTQGDIALLLPGHLPVRAPGHFGTAPARGWETDTLWSGIVPFEELPWTLNPEDGLLVTANDQVVPDEYPHIITKDWRVADRRERILTRLRERRGHDVASFEDILADSRSGLMDSVYPPMLTLLTGAALEPDEASAVETVRSWDGMMDADEAAPLIFIVWQRALAKAIYADELGDQFQSNWSARPVFLARVLRGEGQHGAWCDDITTAARESCADQVHAALRSALDEITDLQGADQSAWRWGEVHVALQRHWPLGYLPVIGRAWQIKTETDGGFYTVNRGAHRYNNAQPYANIHAAGYRAVYDLSDLDNSVWIAATGQSGNPYSPHWDDMAGPWAAGEHVPMTTDRAAIEEGALGRLILEPAR